MSSVTLSARTVASRGTVGTSERRAGAKAVAPRGAVSQRTAPLGLKGSSLAGKSLKLSTRATRANFATAQPLIVEAKKEIEMSIEKPLGITFGAKRGEGGGVVATFVAPGSNAARAGMKSGDQILYHSSFFGDEMWAGESLGFTKTAINACPKEVDFVVLRGKDVGSVNVKRIPSKREAPKKFGKKLTAKQKERATHICVDCGFIYALPVPFEEQPPDYICPQCLAGKSRFSRYDAETGKVIGGSGLPLSVTLSLLVGIIVGGGLIYLGLN